ncbi:FecCD family ABC transporter permease [Celerinatantimonas sp. YJH-8]|uniref:FecCD family ABC transporter permease n=1 Tax=Celerinatantimonas sp. YJH-8 TaxID=3228714 RepID=UPI0038CABD4A
MSTRQSYRLLGLLLVISLAAGLHYGAYAIHWQPGTLAETDRQVLWMIRLPRLLMAMLVGASLAATGVVMQALLRNPMADPGLLGIASGASLAVGLYIVLLPTLAVGWLGSYLQTIVAFVGALGSCGLIFHLAKKSQQVSVLHLLLAGLAINALAGAATGLLTYVSNDQQLRALSFWAMGNLGGARWSHVAIMASLLLPCLLYLCRISHVLNLLLLGEQEAHYLGITVEQLKKRLIFITALCVGICVAFTGLIGFVGLMIPHFIRLLVGGDHRRLLPASLLLGAAWLSATDTLARTLVAPAEIPVGLITSLFGGGFFLWLLHRSFKERSC